MKITLFFIAIMAATSFYAQNSATKTVTQNKSLVQSTFDGIKLTSSLEKTEENTTISDSIGVQTTVSYVEKAPTSGNSTLKVSEDYQQEFTSVQNENMAQPITTHVQNSPIVGIELKAVILSKEKEKEDD